MADHAYDYVLLGTGQATGTLIADLLTRGGSIAVIEGGDVGGTCVNVGCTPTKTLVASAKIAHKARTASEYGVETGPVSVDFDTVMERMNSIRHGSRDGLRGWLTSEEAVTFYHDWGRFVGEKAIAVGDATITAETIFVNVGARARVPSIDGLDDVDWLDNRRILELDAVPEHLVIVGGSYIGLEFGQVFRRFGAEVTILERADRLIGREDPDVSAAVREMLEDEGINIVCQAEAAHVTQADDGTIAVDLAASDGEAARTVAGSHLLIGAGRVPNSDRIDAAAGGLALNDRGEIVVNDVMQTGVEGVYALGDVNSAPGAFTHTSVNDTEIALSYLFGGDVPGGVRTVDDRTLTYALFTDPPLGRVGLTEQQALDEGINLLKATRSMDRISRAKEMGETKGFVKILVDADTSQLVGASVLGANGDEIISLFATIMHAEMPYDEFRTIVLAHPTISELMPWTLDSLEAVTPA
ncbi:mercuric reductase [Salisaeta longa]|uniref:mercuric reductase n=1 Tax=Salisaeta longa TaxID=503170 RepID=UPI0003B71019|nr:mercuric reductase [Salisaeta longa]